MAVAITWKLGVDTVTNVDHGSGQNGVTLTAKTLSIQHDGTNQITGCKFWVDAKTEGYSGDFTPSGDLAEIKGWGDGADADAFGGFWVSMNAAGAFPLYPTYDVKYGADYFTFRTGTADSVENAVTLHTNMNSTPAMGGSGIIPASCSVWPSFQCKVRIPTDEDTVGVRQFAQKLRFTYTS